MKDAPSFRHEFVEYLPASLEDGVVYISMQYATAAHRCACGCGHEVVTPLSPTDWQLFFDGVSISLTPSIGNWNFPCRSHYFIRENKVRWARQWSQHEIDSGRAHDRAAKEDYFTPPPADQKTKKGKAKKSPWQSIKDRLRK
ncbi:MAG TPA: DUF6527 family protein [Bryobacteraceae bacterium]|jgi:hypothetical protein